MTKQKQIRIGSSKNGAEDIKKHKWYRGLNWAALYNKQLTAPTEGCEHTVVVSHVLDLTNFSGSYATSNDESGPMLDADKDAALFNGWDTIAKESDLHPNKGK